MNDQQTHMHVLSMRDSFCHRFLDEHAHIQMLCLSYGYTSVYVCLNGRTTVYRNIEHFFFANMPKEKMKKKESKVRVHVSS